MLRLTFIAIFALGFAAAVPAIQTEIVTGPVKATEADIHKISKDINNSIWCPICEYLVREGEDYLTKNSTEDEATHFLKNACHHLPKSKQEQCEDFVSDNYDKLFHHIIDKEAPPVVCSQLHICKEMEHNDVDECTFCKYAAHRIEKFLHNNNTLLNIIEYGENFCNNVSHMYDSHCMNVIPIYYSEIVAKLVDRTSFIDVCEATHFCDNSHTASEHIEMDNENEEPTHDDDHHDDDHHDDDHHDDDHNDDKHHDNEPEEDYLNDILHRFHN